MKTLTEFVVTTLKNAAQSKESVSAEGKTPEELTAALGEALKLEGDKLNYILGALEVVGTKLADLKRVVVFQLAENEKAPAGAVQKGELYFSVDYYPPVHKPGSAPAARSDDKGKRGDKNGRGGRDGKRGGFGNDRGGAGGNKRPGGDRGADRGGSASASPTGTGALPKPLNTPAGNPAVAVSKPAGQQ